MSAALRVTKNQPPWPSLTSVPRFFPLHGNVEADTVVIGAGITGITTAWHLANAGQRVVIVDMAGVASGESGRTTSHLTVLPDSGVAELRNKHGDAAAALMLAAQARALDSIEACCNALHVASCFTRVPAYIFSEDDAGVQKVDAERESLRHLNERESRYGSGVERLARAPLPFPTCAAIRVEHQAQLEPLAYLSALVRDIIRLGGRIFTDTRVLTVDDGTPCRVFTEAGEVHAKYAILATHTPPNRLAYHAQMFAYRTYALAAATLAPPPPGLYFDTAEPYHYIRSHKTSLGDILIVGGNDHKTGECDPHKAYMADLTAYAHDRFKLQSIDHVWSGQVIESADDLPFVGYNGTDENTLFASGYSGNGITLGTAAAALLSDMVLGKVNPYARLFNSRRLDILAQAPKAIRENMALPMHMVGDRVAALMTSGVDLQPGEGRVITRNARPVAVYRDEAGDLWECSAVCPHLGCVVNWNKFESSWDCPCHGSRFDKRGKLLNGPALQDLASAQPAR